MLPEVGLAMHPIRLKRLVLPEPLGPLMATISPRPTPTVTLSTAHTSSGRRGL